MMLGNSLFQTADALAHRREYRGVELDPRLCGSRQERIGTSGCQQISDPVDAVDGDEAELGEEARSALTVMMLLDQLLALPMQIEQHLLLYILRT